MNYPYLNWINEVMALMEFPLNTVKVITSLYKRVCENTKANTLFHTGLMLYENDCMYEYYNVIENSEYAVEGILGEHKFTGHLLILLCLTRHAKEIYAAKNIPDECYDGFLDDIKIKWAECLAVYGVEGTSTIQWSKRFVDATRFSFGILQFEPMILAGDGIFEAGGFTRGKGDLVINVHIPGGGKLLKEKCEEAFLKAAEFFAHLFPDGGVTFHCSSWLLYPEHKEFLPENSNILMFADFFKCIYSKTNDGHDLWRIFGMHNISDYASLPEKTSLQRLYKKHLMDGGETGIGVGLFIVKNKEFIK